MENRTWRALAPEAIASRSFDDELVLYNEATGSTHYLSVLGRSVMLAVLAHPSGVALETLARRVADDSGVSLDDALAQTVDRTLAELGFVDDLTVSGVFVKTPVFPFVRFPGVDTLLGPEMKSTGEVMGGAESFGSAFAKAQMGAGQHLPQQGTAFLSVNNQDKAAVLPIARDLAALGFKLVATRGTAAYLRAHGIDVDIIFKINEGRPHVGDELLNRRIALVINTPLGRESFFDDRTVRSIAMLQGVPAITTLTGAAAAVSAIGALRSEGLSVKSLQEYHGEAVSVKS